MRPSSETIGTIPLSVPDLRGNEKEYLLRCITDNWVSSAGPFVTEFERKIELLTGRDHAVSTVNGTAALYLALRVAGVGMDDLVIIPDWTFAATANAVIQTGAVPYFVDIAPTSFTLDPELVAKALASPPDGRRIAAVVPVHSAGHPPDIDAISEVCHCYGVPIVEDAAGAIGARYKGRPAGGLGDVAIFSFNGNKVVTAGGGGMIVTDKEDWADLALHLSTQARVGDEYEHNAIGNNLRMTNLNAAVGLAQLERLDEMLAARQRLARRYDIAISQRKDLSVLPCAPWASGNNWMYTVRTANTNDAKELLKHFAHRRIGARSFWRSLSAQTPYSQMPKSLNGMTARISGKTVSLPCSSNLTDSEQDYVIEALDDWTGHLMPKT